MARPGSADSPFVQEYFGGDEVGAPYGGDQRADEVVELLAELHDAEFDELLLEVVHDAANAYAEQARFKAG